MKLRVQLAVPEQYTQGLDLEAVRKVFPYGKMLPVEVGPRMASGAAGSRILRSTLCGSDGGFAVGGVHEMEIG